MKTDCVLGLVVNEHLKKIGINTPTVPKMLAVDKEIKIDKIEKHMIEILSILGLDLADDSLCETPRRVAKMYVDEIFSGLLPENFPKCTTVNDNTFFGFVVNNIAVFLKHVAHKAFNIQHINIILSHW